MIICPCCNKMKLPKGGIPQGIGTALKPAVEMVCLARKPLEGTVAENTLKYGVGGINVDACRVGVDSKDEIHAKNPNTKGGFGHAGAIVYGNSNGAPVYDPNKGRWPANIVHSGDAEVEAAFAAFGEKPTGNLEPHHKLKASENRSMSGPNQERNPRQSFGGDTGTASRFYYSAKASKYDRADSKHPTVKPVNLMRWLVRMVCPPGGTVLDPFAGSGTTIQAAILEGFKAVGIEREAEYYQDILRRLEGVQPVVPVRKKWAASAPLPTRAMTLEEKEARFQALLEGKL